jgi:hypothetical protein
MSTTRSTWRTQARNELDDNAATKLWSDTLLNQWLDEAIRDYARLFPKEQTGTLSTVADQATYTLPSDLVELVRVEHPDSTFRVNQPRVGGDWRRSSDPLPPDDRFGGRYAYDVWGTTLELEPAPTADGETITLRYVARRTEPTGDGDALPVDDGDVEFLTFYVCWRAMVWITGQEAKRQAFERQRGADAGTEARTYRGLYRDGLAARRRESGARTRRLVIRDVES